MQGRLRLASVGLFAFTALMAGCDDPNAGNDTASVLVVAGSSDPNLIKNSAGVAPIPIATPASDIAEIIKHDTIEPITAPPRLDPKPPLKVTVKPIDFTPPPLPPELLDDGGLKPLPTRGAQSVGSAK